MLKPKPGDRVKTMDDAAVYTVVKRLHGDVMLVRTDDGLEIPVSSEYLIVSAIDPESISLAVAGSRGHKKSIVKKKSSPVHKRSLNKEVDLHISGSYSGTDGLSSIELQIMRFINELDKAIREGKKEIIFIHGVGSGKLRNQLRKIVTENYTSCTFQDAPFNKYGVDGATLITISKPRYKSQK
jgi:dsDNA-specific endonuclease/ATPase MutS2